MTDEITPKKPRRRRTKRVQKPAVEHPAVVIEAPDPIEDLAVEAETTETVEVEATPAVTMEVSPLAATYSNPNGEYIRNTFKRRRAARRSR